MEDLTFGEQVKIILGRKGMTIKELAETIEARTGKKMSRQNLTQRLGRDNFQEQDMRMIAAILECPFQLSIMGGETAKAPARTVHPEKTEAEVQEAAMKPEKTAESMSKQEPEAAAAAETAAQVMEAVPEVSEQTAEAEAEAAERAVEAMYEAAEQAVEAEPEASGQAVEAVPEAPEQVMEAENEMPEQALEAAPGDEQDERDMTIGELYEIHEELSELEENAKAGEPVEAIKEELEKPKKERFGNFFLRRRHSEPEKKETKEAVENNASHEVRLSGSADAKPYVKTQDTKPSDFEPVISHDDAEEDREQGEVNPYTGREYQSNSVRMHPTRIGYVQVYDRSIHKWTDMTEWAFLGYQERKKALLGKAYEPPIYLD